MDGMASGAGVVRKKEGGSRKRGVGKDKTAAESVFHIENC